MPRLVSLFVFVNERCAGKTSLLPASLCRARQLISSCVCVLQQVNPSDSSPNAAASPQYFYNFTSWRNAGRGANCRNVGAAIHVGYNLIENGDHEFAWRLLDVAGMQDSMVREALSLFLSHAHTEPFTHTCFLGSVRRLPIVASVG